MKKFLITWGCDPHSGIPYIDCCLAIPQSIIDMGLLSCNLNVKNLEASQYASYIVYMKMRNRIQHTQFAMYEVPDDLTEEEFKRVFTGLSNAKLLKKFKSATIKL